MLVDVLWKNRVIEVFIRLVKWVIEFLVGENVLIFFEL